MPSALRRFWRYMESTGKNWTERFCPRSVPPLTGVMRRAADKVTGREVLVVGPGVKTGLDIRIDNPAQLGPDLVVGAVAAIEEYPCPLVVVDLGTATTFTVVNEKKQVMGGMIMPGVGVALDSLISLYIPASEDQPGSARRSSSAATPWTA